MMAPYIRTFSVQAWSLSSNEKLSVFVYACNPRIVLGNRQEDDWGLLASNLAPSSLRDPASRE